MTQEIQEKSNEIKIAQNEVQEYNARINKLEKEKRSLEIRIIDKKAKPPIDMNDESKAHGQLDEIMRLKDENYHLQHCN